MMEMFLETFNIYGGLPWWGSAVATALLIRIAFVPLMYKANQMTLRSKAAKEVTEPLRARMVEALRTDTGKALVLKAELSAVQKSYGIQFRWVFFPLLQLPLAFGGFRVMRAMSDLPVPGLESESLLWLYDMTMPDPYYVLPAAMALVMWRTMKVCCSISSGILASILFKPELTGSNLDKPRTQHGYGPQRQSYCAKLHALSPSRCGRHYFLPTWNYAIELCDNRRPCLRPDVPDGITLLP
jgi:hypothetical protein